MGGGDNCILLYSQLYSAIQSIILYYIVDYILLYSQLYFTIQSIIFYYFVILYRPFSILLSIYIYLRICRQKEEQIYVSQRERETPAALPNRITVGGEGVSANPFFGIADFLSSVRYTWRVRARVVTRGRDEEGGGGKTTRPNERECGSES